MHIGDMRSESVKLWKISVVILLETSFAINIKTTHLPMLLISFVNTKIWNGHHHSGKSRLYMREREQIYIGHDFVDSVHLMFSDGADTIKPRTLFSIQMFKYLSGKAFSWQNY